MHVEYKFGFGMDKNNAMHAMHACEDQTETEWQEESRFLACCNTANWRKRLPEKLIDVRAVRGSCRRKPPRRVPSGTLCT